MTAFDWILVLLLVISTVMAFVRGVIREIFSLLGWVAGLLLASWYYAPVAGWLGRWITSVSVADVLSFVLIVVVVKVAFGLVGRMLHKTAAAVGMGMLDRMGGAIFGFLRGCVVGTAVMMCVAAFIPDTAFVKQSKVAPYFLVGAHAVSFVVPTDLKEKIASGAKRIRQDAPRWNGEQGDSLK